jgi:F-type H+-transporting ATPase subunit b
LITPVRLASSGLLAVNLTLVIELLGFLVMLGILARWVYPPIIRAAEARQKQVADQLAAAEKARQEAERLRAGSENEMQQARVEAQRIIEAANRSGDRLRQEAQQRAQEEGQRIVEQAHKEIEAERQRAIQAIRTEAADLVVEATRRVLGESLDGERHRKLIDEAIAQVQREPSAAQ